MKLNPEERFASAKILADAVLNIHKHDSRWKIAQTKKIAALIILPLAFALSAVSTIIGDRIIAQEKEGLFYATVFNIDSSDNPHDDFNLAVEMRRNRIDPYRAMALRLWDDGDILAARTFIEANLGEIAKFQSDPEATRYLGDIYHILGDTYYFQPGEPDYHIARQNFEIALRFVTDNPSLHRDYAITLARTGNISAAEEAIETALGLNIETDSLFLVNGELFFAKRDYENAIECFAQALAIAQNEYLIYRAVNTSDEIFKLLGQPERSIELISGTLTRIPHSRVPEITERLINAYIRIGDNENAIRLLEQLSTTGVPQFHILESLARLLWETGELERSAAVLNQMEELFPLNYRVPMIQTFVETHRQTGIAAEDRDSSIIVRYYENAVSLYENRRPGESDPEMQQLELQMQNLRESRWIE
jgi:tetratricopeptide (TPR) repeat protein